MDNYTIEKVILMLECSFLESRRILVKNYVGLKFHKEKRKTLFDYFVLTNYWFCLINCFLFVCNRGYYVVVLTEAEKKTFRLALNDEQAETVFEQIDFDFDRLGEILAF